MNIAIVDDDSIELHAAKKYLSDYLQNNWSQIDFNIQIFSSTKDFFNIFSVGAFQLVILNISMPEIDGLQAARIIRTRGDDDVNIVFLTNNDNFVLSGCKVFAVGYFLKPISRHKDDFNKTFEYILPKINKKSPEITLTVDNVQFNVRIRNILYVDIDYRHRLCIYLADGKKFVTTNNYSEITLMDGTSIPISQRKKKDVKVKYMRYFAHK